ncbi:DDB1- and CUL4-associated factor 17 isoform X2 [Hyperolius riggenbachi]|uniref:DDB1- and CUL4-associated factor 17 isoform X2 n=1 Tax=Hyperolius riggenbachi TaxID=752182 RepID=UPI0035A3BE75
MSTAGTPKPLPSPHATSRRCYARSEVVKNVCSLVTRKCLGSFPKSTYNNHRINMDILRKIMCQKTTKFCKVWAKHSKSSINYVNGRIYFANFGCCFSSIPCRPQQLYEMPRCPKSEKIEDAMLCECPLGEPLHEQSDYTASLIAVTGHNWLLRIAADTGETLQKVYLGSYRKFRYITWDVPQETLVLKSVQKNGASENQQSTVMFYFAIFSVYPLSLVGVLEIDKNVFGSNVSDAMISSGMLIIMHSVGLVRLYSFERIMEQCMQQKYVLGETCTWKGETGTVGDYPFGIPCNITLTERPEVLFEVPCLENAFQVGGYPWHYIITPNKKKDKGTYHIRALADHTLAKNGVLDMKYYSLEPDWIHFHPDASERIIHVGPDRISVLRLKELEEDSCQYEVKEEFGILAMRDHTVNNLVTVTASGRLVKRRYEKLDDDPEQETHSHALVFDRDTLIHIEERPNHNFSCYVYKMHCGSEE